MEVLDKRSSEGGKVDPEPQEVWGLVGGFQPAWNRVLIRRQEVVQQGMIARPEAYTELSERGEIIAYGRNEFAHSFEPGTIATFSKYGAEEKHFDDEGSDKYVLVWINDIRGWHARH